MEPAGWCRLETPVIERGELHRTPAAERASACSRMAQPSSMTGVIHHRRVLHGYQISFPFCCGTSKPTATALWDYAGIWRSSATAPIRSAGLPPQAAYHRCPARASAFRSFRRYQAIALAPMAVASRSDAAARRTAGMGRRKAERAAHQRGGRRGVHDIRWDNGSSVGT